MRVYKYQNFTRNTKYEIRLRIFRVWNQSFTYVSCFFWYPPLVNQPPRKRWLGGLLRWLLCVKQSCIDMYRQICQKEGVIQQFFISLSWPNLTCRVRQQSSIPLFKYPYLTYPTIKPDTPSSLGSNESSCSLLSFWGCPWIWDLYLNCPRYARKPNFTVTLQ